MGSLHFILSDLADAQIRAIEGGHQARGDDMVEMHNVALPDPAFVSSRQQSVRKSVGPHHLLLIMILQHGEPQDQQISVSATHIPVCSITAA